MVHALNYVVKDNYIFIICLVPTTSPSPKIVPGNRSMEIHIEPINEADWNGIPYLYYTFYRIKNSTTRYENVSINASETNLHLTVTGLVAFTDYEVFVTAATKVGEGPKSDIQYIKTDEDGILTFYFYFPSIKELLGHKCANF